MAMHDGGPQASDSVPPDAQSGNRAVGWLALAGGLAAIAVAVVVFVLVLPDRSPDVAATTPSATDPVASGSEVPSAGPSAPASTPPSDAPTATIVPAPTATTDLAWTTTGSFPSSGGPSMVDGVALLGDRYVAVGVEYEQPLPNVGPTPPHVARVWTSDDGRSWDAVDLGAGFENVRLGTPVTRPDGSLLSVGTRGVETDFGIEPEQAAWTTTDGVTWTKIDLPIEGQVASIEAGARGMLAVARPSDGSTVHELWLSTDGITWERTHAIEANYLDLGAGEEGFTAVGWAGEDDGHPISVASADGRAWIDGSPAPFSRFLEVAPSGPDWIIVDDPGGTAATWFSANGLDWTAHGEVPFKTIALPDGECREYRQRLMSTGPWLVVGTGLAYPCSEGGFMVHGTAYLSIDGAAWVALPLVEGTVAESRSGSSVNDALATAVGLILVGEENGAATFWFGEAP